MTSPTSRSSRPYDVVINGRTWRKGDFVYRNPCRVELLEDAYSRHTVQVWCHVCNSTHYVEADGLGDRWKVA